jgi:hypothetical protein
MRRTISIVVGLLTVLGVGAAAAHYLREPYNPGFTVFPVLTGVHVILGGLYLLLAPVQFLPAIRDRFPAYHRFAGRLLVAVGLLVGASAFGISVWIPYSGWSETVIVGGFALFYFFAIALGFAHARARRFELHREWMMRAFSIGLAVATMRLIFIPWLTLLLASGPPVVEQIQMLTIVSFTVAFVVHALGAELWILRTRAAGTVALRLPTGDRSSALAS